MTSSAALAAMATLVSAAFCLSTMERWQARHKDHELAWTLSMAMFTLAALAFFSAVALGWSDANFKAFYLFGAILNVPYLALGTVILLGGPVIARRAFPIMNLVAVFCAGVVLASPITHDLTTEAIPSGKEVLGVAPRIMAAVGSGLGATVLIVGALWSAIRLLRKPAHRGRNAIAPGRLALTNLAIAIGSIVLALGGTLFGTGNQLDDFALALCLGVSILFVGFLISNPSNPTRIDTSSLDPFWSEINDLLQTDAPPSQSA